jgi:DNA-binding Lrp family transcriptional regulator
MKIDRKDLMILKLLQENADISNKQIANTVGLSLTPVFERVKKLNAFGLIDKKVYQLNRKKLGFNLIALVLVTLKQHTKSHVEQFMREMQKHPEIIECFHISGAADFHLKVVIKNIDQYQEFMLNKLSSIESVGHIESYFVLKEVKNTTVLPIIV